MEEADAAGDVVAGSVALRHRQCFGGNIGGEETRMGQLLCERNGDAAGACADIRDEQARAVIFVGAASLQFAKGEAVKRAFDEVFGFRARNEHIGGDLKLKSPKFLLAGEMLNGFAGGASLDKMQEEARLGFGEQLLRVSVKRGTVALEDVKQEQLCGKRIRGNVGGAEAGDALLECGANVHKKLHGLNFANSRQERLCYQRSRLGKFLFQARGFVVHGEAVDERG